MIRRPKPGMQVTFKVQSMTVESVDGSAVWCTWTEGDQLRRGVFAKETLQEDDGTTRN